MSESPPPEDVGDDPPYPPLPEDAPPARRAKRESAIIKIEVPRRLRLDELLRELGAKDVDHVASHAGGLGHDGVDDRHEQHLSIDDVVSKAAEAGFGFLIGILTLIAIPFFGLSTPFGLAIATLGFQLMIGRAKPWLPKTVRKRKLSMAMMDRVLAILTKRTKWLSKSTKRRWEWLLTPRFIGFGVLLLSMALALPLPIPGSNLVFLIPLFIYAIGLLERDGLWIAIGHACALADVALLAIFGRVVVAVLSKIWHWIF